MKAFRHGGDDRIPSKERSADFWAAKLRFSMTMQELEAFGDIKFVSPRRMSLDLKDWTMEEYMTMATGCVMIEALEFKSACRLQIRPKGGFLSTGGF